MWPSPSSDNLHGQRLESLSLHVGGVAVHLPNAWHVGGGGLMFIWLLICAFPWPCDTLCVAASGFIGTGNAWRCQEVPGLSQVHVWKLLLQLGWVIYDWSAYLGLSVPSTQLGFHQTPARLSTSTEDFINQKPHFFCACIHPATVSSILLCSSGHRSYVAKFCATETKLLQPSASVAVSSPLRADTGSNHQDFGGGGTFYTNSLFCLIAPSYQAQESVASFAMAFNLGKAESAAALNLLHEVNGDIKDALTELVRYLIWIRAVVS